MSLRGKIGYLLGGAAGGIGVALALTVAVGALGGGASAEEKRSLPETMKRMKYINEALGVECEYCHVPNKYEIETPRKKTARWMQEHMVDGLVTKEGTRSIDCRTCHEGRARFLPSSQ